MKINRKNVLLLFILILTLSLYGCENEAQGMKQEEEMKRCKENANLTDRMSAEELYQEALKEDTMV